MLINIECVPAYWSLLQRRWSAASVWCSGLQLEYRCKQLIDVWAPSTDRETDRARDSYSESVALW